MDILFMQKQADKRANIYNEVSTAVLPVAGLGTRFLPASKSVPKELFPILNIPLIEYAVREAVSAGAKDFVFIISHNKQSIIDYFSDDAVLCANLIEKGKGELIDCVKGIIPGAILSVEQPQALGLGHAISLAKDIVGDNPFHVLLPDDLIMATQSCQSQLLEQFIKTKSSVVAVEDVPLSQVHNYGVLDIDESVKCENSDLVRVKGFVEKPDAANAPSTLSIIGRYIFTSSIFEILDTQKSGKGGEIQITDAMARLLGDEDFYGLRFKGERFDCGSKAGFLEAQIAFAKCDDQLCKILPKLFKKYS